MELTMLNCTGIGAPLSCDYTSNSFIVIFTPNMNKWYGKAVRY